MSPRFVLLSLLAHAALVALVPVAAPAQPPQPSAPGPALIAFEPVVFETPARREGPVAPPRPPRPAARARPSPARRVEPRPPAEDETAAGGETGQAAPRIATPAQDEDEAGVDPGPPLPQVEPAGGPTPPAVDVEAVRVAIDRRLHYPPRARRMGWEGRVWVAFEVDERGEPGALRVMVSSGFASLDEAALEAVRAAAPFAVPARRVTLEVPVAFHLAP